MSGNNGRFRKKKVYFTQVSNNALRDKNLSLQAKGLYAVIQSYITIEDFILYKSHLMKEVGLSEKTFDKYWKELKDRGYLIQHKYYEKGSKGAQYEYELLDIGNEVFTPQNLTCKKLTPKNLTRKKMGGFNNTDSNNTDSNNTNINQSNNKKTYCNTEDKEIVERLIEDVQAYTLYGYKRLDIIKFLNAAYGDIEVIKYVYDNVINNVLSNTDSEKPIKNIVAYIVKSIKNEIKQNGIKK